MEEIKLYTEEIDNQFRKINLFKIISAILAFVFLMISVIFTSMESEQTKFIPKEYYIGEVGCSESNISIKINKVENVKQLGEGTLLIDTTNNNFALITYTITNNSKKTIENLSCLDFTLYSSNNVEYEYFNSLYIDYPFLEDISPGITKTFQVVFEIPTTTEDSTYKLIYEKNSSKNKITFILKSLNGGM